MHVDAQGTPFYIGKGKDRRAWAKAGRSPEWQQKALNGYEILIHSVNLQESDALTLEHRLICRYRAKLVNKTSGGGKRTTVKGIHILIQAPTKIEKPKIKQHHKAALEILRQLVGPANKQARKWLVKKIRSQTWNK
jgi:hypothetical protein